MPAAPVSQLEPYVVRRSRRSRRVRVMVHPGGVVEVVLPEAAPDGVAGEAVEQLRPWIRRRRSELAQARAQWQPVPGHLPYLDDALRLVREPGRRSAGRHDDELRVPAGELARPLEDFYRRAARAEITTRLEAACARAGTSYAGLTIRGQKTRWASCSARGGMSFNWKLLLAPSAVLDYVVEHEVCHLEVSDHSPRFWALVERRSPDYRRQAEWLRRHGPLLSLDFLLGASGTGDAVGGRDPQTAADQSAEP